VLVCRISRHFAGQAEYLGAAGWEISDGKTVVLIDPYVSRLRHVIPADDVLPTDTRQLFTNDVAPTDTAVVDAHVQRADFVLITHTHFDPALDLPYIAAKTGATIIGTESTYNLARAYGIPGNKLIMVRGGEDYGSASESFGLSVLGTTDALGSLQCHVRGVAGTGASAAPVVYRRSESRFPQDQSGRAEVLRGDRCPLSETRNADSLNVHFGSSIKTMFEF
jgi:hypothetical protein